MKDFIQKISETRWSTLSEQTIEASKKVMLDTIGSILAGTKEESTQNLIEQLENYSFGDYIVIGSHKKFNLQTAGFINGTATVAIEQDEGNQWSKGHPAAHIIPTMLTYVQTKQNYSGKQFILELVKSYEACSRFGRATTLLPEAHAHGTWGVMGSAMSVLLLENVSTEELYEGVNISASFAMPTMWSSALSGSLIRNIYVGQSVESGIKTFKLLKSGFLAPENSINYIFGEVLGTSFDRKPFLKLFEKWDIERNYYKDHAFCRYAHAPLDAFKMVVLNNKLKVSDIKDVYVRTYSRAATLKSSKYHNALSAKFSIPYALSAWIYERKSDHSVFVNKYLMDKNIRKFANKIKVSESKELEENYPTIMAAEIEIRTYSGETYKQRLDNADTGLGESVSFEALTKKFKLLASHLSEKRQANIINWISNMEQKKDMNELINLLFIGGKT